MIRLDTVKTKKYQEAVADSSHHSLNLRSSYNCSALSIMLVFVFEVIDQAEFLAMMCPPGYKMENSEDKEGHMLLGSVTGGYTILCQTGLCIHC